MGNTGMNMMVKSMLGIDPSEIQEKLTQSMDLLKSTLTHFDARLTVLEQEIHGLSETIKTLKDAKE